jgi:hypothetical protein
VAGVNSFSEAWLKEYQAKRSGIPTLGKLFTVRFTLARPTILLNELMRMHYRVKAAHAVKLSSEIARLTTDIEIDQPFKRAILTVDRYSVKEPDQDGLLGGCKILIDCLLVRSARHPHGLGFIVDDSPAHLTLRVSHVKSPTLKGQATTVTIERDGQVAA